MRMNRKNKIISLAFLAFTLACNPKKALEKQAGDQAPEAPRETPAESPRAPSENDVEVLYAAGLDVPEEYKTEGALRSGAYWDYVRAQKDARLEAYLKENKLGLEAFVKSPVSSNGTPALIFRLLPDVLPQLFSDAAFTAATGYYKLDPKDFLPYGFAYTKPAPGPDAKPSPLLVQISCAACHTGRVILKDGKTKMIVGAPSTVADINAFRSTLTRAVRDPNYTLEKFTAALESKKDGELYGPDRIAEEKVDRAIFKASGAALLKAFQDGLVQRADYAAKTAGTYSLKNDLRLMASTPGHIDFGIAVSLATAPQAEIAADPQAALKKYFPPGPGIADIMSVWQQSDRTYAQWDGNLKNKLTRNLGAELGVAGDPRAVNFPNALVTTGFVEKLPAPAYPFKVDMIKAATGKKIYDQACASCHESEAFIPLDKVGTEPGRALGLTKDTRLLLTAALRAACTDKSLPDCQAPDHELVVPREDKPGYLSLPLDGIWARAPYLHNGSVPTLWHLLLPEERPEEFQLNDFNYDEKFVGFSWRLKGGEDEENPRQNDRPNQNAPEKSLESSNSKALLQPVIYDTTIPGLSRQGHADKAMFNGGIDFRKEPAKLDALLEYLKTL